MGKKPNEGAPWWLRDKESVCQCRRHRFNPWVKKICCRRKWQHIPVFLPGKFHGQRSLVGSSPQSRKSKSNQTTKVVHYYICINQVIKWEDVKEFVTALLHLKRLNCKKKKNTHNSTIYRTIFWNPLLTQKIHYNEQRKMFNIEVEVPQRLQKFWQINRLSQRMTPQLLTILWFLP